MSHFWRALTASAVVLSALLTACGEPDPTATDAGTRDAAPLDPPDPYVPSAAGAPECELSADCPPGTYCDLGECIQRCNTVDPCTGELTCTPRGRCDEDSMDEDPAPAELPRAALVADPVALDIAEDVSAVMLGVNASPLTTELPYRVDSRVPWLRSSTERGTFTGALVTMLEVDRTGLAAGEHAGTVVIHTAAGAVTVPVRLTQGLSGVYDGSIEYETPRALGKTTLRFELVEDRGFAAIRVDPAGSPLFPTLGGLRVTTSATVTDGTIEGAFLQRLLPTDLGASAPIVDRDLGREFRFTLAASAGGGLEGTFVERWIGVAPTPLEVGGTIALRRRTGIAPGVFDVAAPPALPSNPTANAPAITSGCSAAATSSGGPGPCTMASTGTQLVACGDAILARGATIENTTNGLVVGSPARGYDSFASTCALDLTSATASTPSSLAAGCIRAGNLACATALYGRAGTTVTAARLGVGEATSAQTNAALLVVNDRLVDAFTAPYRAPDGTSAEMGVVDALTEARSFALPAIRAALTPYGIETLRTTPTSVAAMVGFEPLRRLAQLVARDRMAAERLATIRVRSLGADRETVRGELSRDALALLIELVALADIERGQGAPAQPELALFAQSLTQLSSRFREIDDGVDPFGLPPGFVAFIYDFDIPSRDNAEQLLDASGTVVSNAVSLEAMARSSTREVDQSLDQLISALEREQLQAGSRLAAICGGTGPAPDTATCGETGGELSVARNQFTLAQQEGRLALQRVQSLEERVRIQEQRLAEVYGIRQDTIQFVDSTGRRIAALEVRQGELAAIEKFISIAASGNLFNGFAPAVAAGGAAVISLMQTELEVEKGNLARNQTLRLMMADSRVEYINGAAAIQEMLVGMSEVLIEAQLAATRVVTASLVAANLQREVESIQAERDLNVARLLSPARLANDPSVRVLRDRLVGEADAAREVALRRVYDAARAYEYARNIELPFIESKLVPALRASDIQQFAICLTTAASDFTTAYGAEAEFTDEISVREDILGIRAPVPDAVTGAMISEGEQFRRLLLQPSNIGAEGTVALRFATALRSGNGVFSTAVCNDQVRTIQVKLIGDGLGDDQARVYIRHGGAHVQRSCDSFRGGREDVVQTYQGVARQVEVQAGVNAYPTALPDTQLTGRSVAASEWQIAIPPGSAAPVNTDLDLNSIEDIVLRVSHRAVSLSDSPVSFAPTCGI